MITEYTIENFKAFAGPATVPIKPITFIFGPNSSGKSSIFQSILMLKQTLEEAKNKEQILLPKGTLVDLGNYREFVNGHSVEKKFSVKIVIPTPKSVDDSFPVEDYLSQTKSYSSDTEKLNKSINFKNLGLRILFSLNKDKKDILIEEVDLFIGDGSLPIVKYLNAPPEETQLSGISDSEGANVHPFVKYRSLFASAFYEKSPSSLLKLKSLNKQHKYWHSYCEATGRIINLEENELLNNEEKALAKTLLEKIGVKSSSPLCGFDDDFIILHNFLPALLNGEEPQYLIFEDFGRPDQDNISLFTLSISYSFRKFLESVIHIGPQRDYPQRYYSFSGIRTESVGQTGKYVPDILINDQAFVKRVDKRFDRLNLKYELKVAQLISETADIHDLFALRLYNKETDVYVSMTDVGFGVSQVLPIIVQSMLSKEKTILIEQPELHLHPAQQAELGDMFIEAALGENKNTFLIETHSEHLILRIMRRIRETHNGTIPDGLPGITPNDVAVLYVEPDGAKGSIIREMPLNERGELVKAWPGGFFEEGLREVLS